MVKTPQAVVQALWLLCYAYLRRKGRFSYLDMDEEVATVARADDPLENMKEKTQRSVQVNAWEVTYAISRSLSALYRPREREREVRNDSGRTRLLTCVRENWRKKRRAPIDPNRIDKKYPA